MPRWRRHEQAGPRWTELVATLQHAQPASPRALARLLHAIADLDAAEAGAQVSSRDASLASALLSLPDAPLPLAAALVLCADADGYVPAAAQATLLEGYGGVVAAAGAQALAADMRAVWETERPPECPPLPGPQRRSRGRRRARQHQRRRSPEGVAKLPQPETCARSVDGGAGAPTSAARPAAGVPVAAWEQLDAVDLQEELRHPVPTLQDVPPFMRSSVRGALVLALNHLRSAGDEDGATLRAWKLFLLAPRMLLARPAIKRGPGGREELLSRAAAFQQGEWIRLLREARQLPGAEDAAPEPNARQVLTAPALAPGTEQTYAALTDPARRPAVPRQPIPPDTLAHEPAEPVTLTPKAVASALRDARRGAHEACGLSTLSCCCRISPRRSSWPTPPRNWPGPVCPPKWPPPLPWPD